MGPTVAVAQVRHAVRAALTGLPLAQPVFVACSGGADSLALATAVAFETGSRRGTGRTAGLVTVDHGLQAGSAEQAARVAQFGFELGFDPVVELPVEVGGRGGPEAAARDARYAALDDLARAHGATILLGHTLDDQAETVLLGLGRGSGPRSIAGMLPRSGVYVRPLLGLRRETTVAACAALGLEPWQDPHNDDPSFQRVRLRRLIPELENALQGGVAEALARTAGLLREDLEALDAIAADALSAALAAGAEGESIPVASLEREPRAVRTRMIRAWLTPWTGPLAAAHVDAVAALVENWHGQGRVDLPRAVAAYRTHGRIFRISHP